MGGCLVHARCKACGELLELPEPPVREVVKREPCRCGMTEGARGYRYLLFAFLAAILALLGCCVSSHYWTTRQVEAVKGVWEIRESIPRLMNENRFEVAPILPKPPSPERK